MLKIYLLSQIQELLQRGRIECHIGHLQFPQDLYLGLLLQALLIPQLSTKPVVHIFVQKELLVYPGSDVGMFYGIPLQMKVFLDQSYSFIFYTLLISGANIKNKGRLTE
ncbi:hypothetical protein D3C71_1409730 [compost metagenome]